MDLNKIACKCFDITTSMIKDAVDAGATTIEDVVKATGIGNACGICLNDLQRRIDYFLSKQNN